MAFNRGAFRSKGDAMSRAKAAHMCCACLYSQPKTFIECPQCQTKGMRKYFRSAVELSRAAELILMQKSGQISGLRFLPRYQLTVEGSEICVYEADSEYREGGKTVVEDVKSGGTFIDAVSELKISLFNAIHKRHGISVRLHRRK